jgi:hypothetical protein
MLIKVEGTPYSKDMKTKALLTTSPEVLAQNEARKRLSASLKGKDSEINKLKMDMEKVQNDLSDIKTLLQQLLSK